MSVIDDAGYVENSASPRKNLGADPQFLNVRLLGRPPPTGSVPRNGCLSMARGTTRARRRRNVEKRRKIAFGSPGSRNRKQKYGGNHANEFADPDFLFDFVYIRAQGGAGTSKNGGKSHSEAPAAETGSRTDAQ